MTGASIVITSAPAVDADVCFQLGHPAHNKAAAAFITPEAFDAAVPGDEGFMLRSGIQFTVGHHGAARHFMPPFGNAYFSEHYI